MVIARGRYIARGRRDLDVLNAGSHLLTGSPSCSTVFDQDHRATAANGLVIEQMRNTLSSSIVARLGVAQAERMCIHHLALARHHRHRARQPLGRHLLAKVAVMRSSRADDMPTLSGAARAIGAPAPVGAWHNHGRGQQGRAPQQLRWLARPSRRLGNERPTSCVLPERGFNTRSQRAPIARRA
jgi:hypothetical protein